MTLQAKSYDLRLRVLEMIHIGEKPVFSKKGLVTSLAWGMEGKVDYVLEGNINYTGAVTKWVVEELGLLSSSKEAGPVAQSADPADTTYLVPAFTGLGAPYWDSGAKAMLYGMSRTTGRAEIVKAAEGCIAYQIADVLELMGQEAGVAIQELWVDGGPAKDKFLMQFQSDILNLPVAAPEREELSGLGAALLRGHRGGGVQQGDFSSRAQEPFPARHGGGAAPEKERGLEAGGGNAAHPAWDKINQAGGATYASGTLGRIGNHGKGPRGGQPLCGADIRGHLHRQK